MNDDLVYSIFKELAVLEGKRKVTGEWVTSDPRDLSRLLKTSFSVVRRASDPGERRPKPAKGAAANGEG